MNITRGIKLGFSVITLAAIASGWVLAGDAKTRAAGEANFGSLFVGSPKGKDGEKGCEEQYKNKYDGNWESYFHHTSTSMTMTAGDSCRTVNTKTNNSCVFNLGDGGVTNISFDFDISQACHSYDSPTVWLAFWMFSEPWNHHVEVDFIESLWGPGAGLNTNFAGKGLQRVIFPALPFAEWKGSISADFQNSGNDFIVATVNNRINGVSPTAPAVGVLSRAEDYFFVLDTTPTQVAGCAISISNLKIKGDVSSAANPNNCAGTQ